MAYPLASNTWDKDEIEAIHRVIASGRFTMGKEVAEFEKRFAYKFGHAHAIMTNSGSSANLLMLAALYYHPQFYDSNSAIPNIIVPAVGWSTTFFPVHQMGFILKFVDVDPNTFNIDVAKAEAAIDSDTVAIMVVNLLGNPCQLDALVQLCAKHNLTLLEDNCESLGAKLNGKHTGTFGKMASYSFFFSHHIQTMEGGMVVTDDPSLVDYLVSLRAHGWVRGLTGTDLHKPSGDSFEDSFKFVLPGYCVRPLEMSGAVGREQLHKWDQMFWRRRWNAAFAQDLFDDCEHVRLQHEIGESSWFGFGLVLQGALLGRRKEVVAKLAQSQVECRPIVTGNFLRQPVTVRHLHYIADSKYIHADDLHDNGLMIGNDNVNLRKNIRQVAAILKDLV